MRLIQKLGGPRKPGQADAKGASLKRVFSLLLRWGNRAGLEGSLGFGQQGAACTRLDRWITWT